MQPHILKISIFESSRAAETLRLEGHLGGPWVDELRRSCDRVRSEGKQLTLDLSGVSFVDHEGVGLLRGLKRRNVELRNCSPFVQLRLEEGGLK
ncbi:MAG: STAS domain-containing protein [Acidobacteria bacterium]|nr:STAS domain-containing protein [Acidobacteriota bacterium]MBV8893548.1 STAS domain-containing protein [Acidobacteriota bacterium]MBV9484074.1 STAS domain-containing protein [Acidobacteriota bacterium]